MPRFYKLVGLLVGSHFELSVLQEIRILGVLYQVFIFFHFLRPKIEGDSST